MITRSAQKFLAAFQATEPAFECQSAANSVFLVEPDDFRVAAQSAGDNAYMKLDESVDSDRAQSQFYALVKAIKAVGVQVKTFPGLPTSPDGVFPNNVYAAIPGRFIVGAMYHPVRQQEGQRQDIRAWFADDLGYDCIDLSRQGVVAELTGSLVIDRKRRVGYCGMSNRVDDAGCMAMAKAFDLALCFQFDLDPQEYHTNVVMSVLASRACMIHPPSLVDPEVASAILAAYPGKSIVLSDEEKQCFVGNCIALTDQDLFMSKTADGALAKNHRQQLTDLGFVIHSVELDEIEKAGGSLRCMVAEVF